MGQPRAGLQTLQRREAELSLEAAHGCAAAVIRRQSRANRPHRIASFIAEYRYEPDVEQLRLIVLKLYDLSDRQTRGLLEFGLLASAGVLQSLHGPAPVIGDPAPSI